VGQVTATRASHTEGDPFNREMATIQAEGVTEFSGYRTVAHSDVAQPPSAVNGRDESRPYKVVTDSHFSRSHPADVAAWLAARGGNTCADETRV